MDQVHKRLCVVANKVELIQATDGHTPVKETHHDLLSV